MQNPTLLQRTHGEYDERFLEFIKLLAAIERNHGLFPKDCRTCGRKFVSFSEYFWATTCKGHGLEDCSDVMLRPFTMIYRHCPCGNTLVVTLTRETFPMLDNLWAMLQRVAAERQEPLQTVVSQFVEKCSDYILARNKPCPV